MKELKAYFATELPRINAFLETEIGKLEGLIQDILSHSLLSGGKRIRPVLTLAMANVLPCTTKKNPLPLACALEMLHTATLLHDDILDAAQFRRGLVAAHKIFGTTETILAGDMLLALANRIGASCNKVRISQLLAQGIIDTATGEVQEIAMLGTSRIDRKAYMEVIIGKTAKLIETACRCGVAFASDDPALEDAAGEYGLNLGIAFQLVDDALDYVSDTGLTGKPLGGDLREGKMTLPLILLIEHMPTAEAEALLEKLREDALTEQEIRQILADVAKHDFAQQTRQEATAYVAKAKAALEPLPEGKEKIVLKQAADFVLAREK